MSGRLPLKAVVAVVFAACSAASAATSGITSSVVLANKGGRVTFERADNAILSDPVSQNGYRDVWRFTLDASGKVASRICLTCDNPEMPFHNGNPRYDPFGRGFMFQVENRACNAALLGSAGSPGSGSCNDWWWWAAGNQQFYPISAPLPAYDGTYAQMHGKWSKNADYFMYGYRLPQRCNDTYGCALGGSWELQAAEIIWTNPAPNVYVPQFGTIHHYSPGNWPNHFYQMNSTSPVDNGVVVFESNSFVQVSSDGDIDVATMRVRDSSGNWLSNDQANATVTVLSEFSNDGSHTAEWNELASFTPDGTQVQWMSNHGYPAATGLADLYSDYWRSKPDGSGKYQISFFNTPGYPEYTGKRTIASNYVFLNVNQFYSYIYIEGSDPDNIYEITVPQNAPVVVTNAATFFVAPGIAPGGLAVAFVTGITGFSATAATSLPWPTSLAGVTVTVNDVPAPVYYVSPASGTNRGQVNFQVPAGTQTGQARIQINGLQGTAIVVPVSPGIFVSNLVSMQGAVLNQNYGLNAPGVKARRGEVIQIFATGGGPLQTPVLDGVGATPFSNTTYTPQVYFGDTQATVQFSGVAGYPGLWQINAYVPVRSAVTGLVPIYVVQNGVPSNQITVWIEP